MRHPILAPQEYGALYAGVAGRWSSPELRPDQRRVADLIRARFPAGGRVLDIGCFQGSLLGSLGDAFDKFGIEPSVDARSEAQGHGVRILGASFGDLEATAGRFDAITAIDVIEHVPDPLAFVRQLSEHLTPQGVLIIATGDASSRAWRLLGPGYYYSHNFEHISFISRPWCEFAARQGGLAVLDYQDSLRHTAGAAVHWQARCGQWLKLGVQVVLSMAERTLWCHLPTVTRRAGPWTQLGCAGMFGDHLLVIFGSVAERAEPGS
ncbi:class I SAM-dependent methyltransferase [Methylibium sp.]|uniref:class I SAM-dependent methyltransferase n=1 Tax=Methylibium sp. TaxID=2067992 RepID=UPI003D0D1F27